jgi:hypothetical protein
LIEWVVLAVVIVLLLVGWSRAPRTVRGIVGLRLFGSVLLTVGAVILAIWILVRFFWVIVVALILVGGAAFLISWLRRG